MAAAPWVAARRDIGLATGRHAPGGHDKSHQFGRDDIDR
jgi:hypothetical protein